MTSRRRTRRPALLLSLACLALASCMAGTTPAPTGPPAGPVDPLADIARREGDVRVMVVLAVEPEEPGGSNRREVAQAQERLLRQIRPGVRIARRFDEAPLIALRVTAPALQRLRESDLVLDITLAELGGTNQ